MKKQSLLTFRNIFLYVVIFLLPLAVSYYALRLMISEQHLSRKDLLEQELNLQAAKVPVFSTDEFQFKDFFNILFNEKQLMKKSPAVISQVIERIEELYPGGFKWIFMDKNANTIPVKSRQILEGRRSWEYLFINIMTKYKISFENKKTRRSNFEQMVGYSLDILQKALGKKTKIEHLDEARQKPMDAEWFGRPCMLQWDIDVVSYEKFNVPDETRGGCLVMAFKEALGENFWLKRFLKRRNKIADRLPFALIAFNLTEREPLHIEDSLKYRLQFKNALKGYLGRSSDIFEFGNFMAKASVHEQDSQIRILSLVDLTEINEQRKTQLNWLNFSALFVFLLTLTLVFTLHNRENLSLSLRNRIAVAFLIAIFLPVLSLVSIGKSFLSHEEKRLTEAAYVEMDTGLEALALRYKDAPRTLEKGILNEILDLLGSNPQTIEQAKSALDKAAEMDLMRNYVVCDKNGKFIFDNWPNIHPAFEAAIKFSIKQLAENDQKMVQARSSPLKDAIDEELENILDLSNLNIDLNRPSHLRYYVLQDFHTYFMTATLTIKGIPHFLYLHIPDYIVEQHFVRAEFAKNLMATRTAKGNRYELQSELFVYSRYFAESHLPEKTELWDKLKDEFVRAYELKVKETGRIKLDNETFLYTIMPLRTMHRQGYIPCLLTTTRQIEARLRNLSIAIFALAAFAALGALLLSLALADSLLGPIKNIDEAAQQVGKGNLQIKLPQMGNDELGRLSLTFNNMVEGLRERERMLAYVSESVREAIQDKADQSAAAGKTINATILFSDIRNFTGLTEQYPPQEIFALLNEFLGGVEPIIRENSGRIDKFIGDAVMAVFHEHSPDKHAYCAVQAAVAMKSFVKNLNLRRQKQSKFPVNIGIGISTGTVLLGDVGSSRRKDLTVIGDEVNLAARLEQASKQGRHSRIIVSASTYNYVQKKVEVEEMEIKEVRGKKQAVKIYEWIKIKET